MQNIRETTLFTQCRLCGVLGAHQIEIWDDSPTSDDEFTLREKIFECVRVEVCGFHFYVLFPLILISRCPMFALIVQVERDDVTTKLCTECYEKINKYFAFREFCSTKNINCMLHSIANAMDGVTNNDPRHSRIVEPSSPNREIDSNTSCGTDLDLGNTAGNEHETVPIMIISVTDTDSDDEGNNAISQRRRIHLRKRLDARHNRHKKLKCPIRKCDSSFQNRLDLWKHIESMHNIKMAQPSKSEQLSRVNEHLQRIHCNRVESTDEKTKKTDRHPAESHVKERFWCKMWRCDESFESREALAYHQGGIYHRRGIRLTFECYLCGKVSTKYTDTRKHMYRMHFRQKWLTCPIPGCATKFTRNENMLIRHIKSNHKNRVIQYGCNERNRTFNSEKRLEQHKHRTDRDISLLNCSKWSGQSLHRNSMKEHVRNEYRQESVSSSGHDANPLPLSNDHRKDVLKFKPFFGWGPPVSKPNAERERKGHMVPPQTNGRQKNKRKFKPFYGWASPTS